MSRTTCSHSITHTQPHANLDVVSPVSPVILFSRCWLVREFVPVYQASSLYLKPRFPAGCPRSAGSSLASFMVAVLSMIPPASTQPALPHFAHRFTSISALALRRLAFLVVALSLPPSPSCLPLSQHIRMRGIYCSARQCFTFFCSIVSRISYFVHLLHGSILYYRSIFSFLSSAFWLYELAHSRLVRSPVLRSACLSNFCRVRIPHFSNFFMFRSFQLLVHVPANLAAPLLLQHLLFQLSANLRDSPARSTRLQDIGQRYGPLIRQCYPQSLLAHAWPLRDRR